MNAIKAFPQINAKCAFGIWRVVPTEYKMSDFAVLTPTYEELKLSAIPTEYKMSDFAVLTPTYEELKLSAIL